MPSNHHETFSHLTRALPHNPAPTSSNSDEREPQGSERSCHTSHQSDTNHLSEQLVERLSDQSLLSRSVRRQAQDGNAVRGHDRVFARVALLLLLAVAVILPAVDLNGEDQAPCHPRVHPEVEGAIREYEGALLLAEATSVRQRVPEEYFGLIAEAYLGSASASRRH